MCVLSFLCSSFALEKIRTIRYRLSFSLIVSCMQNNVFMCECIREYVEYISKCAEKCRMILITVQVKQVDFERYKCHPVLDYLMHTVCGLH